MKPHVNVVKQLSSAAQPPYALHRLYLSLRMQCVAVPESVEWNSGMEQWNGIVGIGFNQLQVHNNACHNLSL